MLGARGNDFDISCMLIDEECEVKKSPVFTYIWANRVGMKSLMLRGGRKNSVFTALECEVGLHITESRV